MRPGNPSSLRPRAPHGEQAAAWERLGSVLLWYVFPGFALALILGYLGLAIAWHANPPVVPVLGISMHPTLHAGDLVFVKGVDPRTLKKGDVIAFKVPKDLQEKYNVPASYVHRIVGIERDPDGQIFFATKGDNVRGPEPFKTAMQNVVGKMVAHVPKLGYPILFVRSKQGLILLGAVLIAAFLYVLLGFYDRRQEFAEANALRLSAIVDEARALRDSMAGVSPAAPRAPPPPPVVETVEPEPTAPRMLEVEGAPPEGAVLCSQGCHVLLPGARFDPHTGEPVEVPEPESSEAPTEELAPVPSSRALVPYVAPGIDFENLEREIHEAVRSSADVEETMHELVGAIGEYGEHLRSHTAVMQNLAEVSGELKETTSEMRAFLASLTSLLTRLVEQSQAPPES
jgi:signal peptidase